MAETQTLNFGPEWLRALSGGGSVTSPPLSPALPKYKLADYRYGREEMLALYVKDNKIPVDLQDKEFLSILQEEPLPPLALVPFTEEEQRNFMSVNSAAVLRLTGRGGGTVAGAPRGRSSSRGRGRGRGEGGFYQRSFDDVEGGFARAREMHRSQSWEESKDISFPSSRGDRRFEKPGRKEPEVAPAHFQLNHIRSNYEDGGTGVARKHDFTRSESENWRTSREEHNGEDDEGGWRLAGSRRDSDRWRPHSPDGLRSSGWREHPDSRRRFPFDSREEERGYRRVRTGSSSQDEERDGLPEWCLDDADEEMGTFDSSGAFLSLKKAPKEPIPEEAELDFRPSEECEEHLEREDNEPGETKETEKAASRQEYSGMSEEEAASITTPSAPCQAEPLADTPLPPSQPERVETPPERVERQPPAAEVQPEPRKAAHIASTPSTIVEGAALHHAPSLLPEMPASAPVMQQKPLEMPSAVPAQHRFPEGVSQIGRPGVLLHVDTDDDEGLKHFEQEAEKMVAYLQDNAVDDDRLTAKMAERAKPTGFPLTHDAALKWFYKDPQGEIQGPFTNQEMMEWFQAGYFTMTLLVKRGCDDVFQPLGEIIKMWGRVPFTPGPTPPPLLGDVDQERLKRQRELAAVNLYQLQQLQYQYLLRQQYAQALAQHKATALGASQQQQQQINLLLQQYQALKMRTSEPPVTRSMSVPDSGSVWELQNSTSQPSATAPVQHVAHSAWDSGSVWDLPIDSMAPAPTIEQMQQVEKAKAAKMEQERHEAELQAKREEEERKRQEEALLRQQEEERKRREEEEQARRNKEEALRRLLEQEAALRRQKEEEERQAQERRREEEERRQREEMLRKQEEEQRKQEEQRRLEEEKRLAEEAAARQRLQEEQKRKEQEQRRKEQELQRQQELQQQEQLKKEQELQRQRQQQQEALRRLQQQQQQQQLAQMKLPSSSKWGHQSSSAQPQTQNTLSLAEIQKLEEERERQAREERRQQQELMKALHQQQQQQQQQQAKLSGWGNVAKQPAATKSLLEIQQEEAQQMKQQQKQQQKKELQSGGGQQSWAQSRATMMGNSVWGCVNNSTPQWNSSDVGCSIWGSPDYKNSVGFWDEPVKEAAPSSKKNTKNKSNAHVSNSLSGRANKKVEEEEKKLMKLFQGVNNSQDSFTQWCEQTLHTLNTANNLDVPTFASFLKEVDSPYEVHDYIRAYLGDTPEAKDFAKQFLERRAKQKASQQQQQRQVQQQKQPQHQQQQESVWGVNQTGLQSIFQSNHATLHQSNFETVQSGKKKKKQKMVRADPSLLGFSVNAASERLNMGEIETVEDF